jgi:hypothetical protein
MRRPKILNQTVVLGLGGLRVTPGVLDALDQAARTEDRSRSGMIRHLVVAGLRSRGLLPELEQASE